VSPLTQGLRYRAACDKTRTRLPLFLFVSLFILILCSWSRARDSAGHLSCMVNISYRTVS